MDCPGKVYKTGPEETLKNFSAHLRFKGHRNAVNARLRAEGIITDSPGPAAGTSQTQTQTQ